MRIEDSVTTRSIWGGPGDRRTLGPRPSSDEDTGPRAPRIGTGPVGSDEGVTVELSPAARSARDGTGKKELSDEDKDQVRELEARDSKVRAHEAAHQAAAGGLGGGASFTYEIGPDGRRYAVGGEVPVQLRTGRTPEETISNAQKVRSAALAPADPSAQDLAVASQAAQMEAQARQQQMKSGDEQDPSPAPGDKASQATKPLASAPASSIHVSGDGCASCRASVARYAQA